MLHVLFTKSDANRIIGKDSFTLQEAIKITGVKPLKLSRLLQKIRKKSGRAVWLIPRKSLENHVGYKLDKHFNGLIGKYVKKESII